MFKVLLSIAILAGFEIWQSRTKSEAICEANGDPHFRTFDGKWITFQGVCQYVLAEAKNVTKEKQFTVLVRAVDSKSCGRDVSCINEVDVNVKNVFIVLKHGGDVTVYGHKKSLPYNHNGVDIVRNGRKVKVTTGAGLTVEYDTVYNVYITVADSYRGRTQGICGNFDGDPNNLMKRNKEFTKDDQQFVNSWKNNKSCFGTTPCKSSSMSLAKECDLLRGDTFSACHAYVHVDKYIENCKYDVCAEGKHPRTSLCEAFDSYAVTCGYARKKNLEWKNATDMKISMCTRLLGKKSGDEEAVILQERENLI